MVSFIRVARYGLRVTCCALRVKGCAARVTSYGLRGTDDALDSYQISFAQIVQSICWPLCKVLTNRNLRELALNSTFCIIRSPPFPAGY